MALFYGWGSTASRLEPLRGGSLLFTTILVCRSRSDFHIEDILLCADHAFAKRVSTTFLVVLNHKPVY